MRKSLLITTSAFLASAVSLSAFARDYGTANLPYSDKPTDRPTAIAISTLTDEGVLEGDPGGTIRPGSELNRAEFMKIVMSLMPVNDWSMYSANCFPDVASGTWYSPYVCRAKTMGIVSGHAREGVPQSQWLFRPNAPVQYEEALKVLAETYALTLDNRGGAWFDPYIRAAEANDLAISGLRPGDRLKRGEMARLVVAFMAFNDGTLADLRNAEMNVRSSSSSSSSVLSGTGSSMSSSMSSSSRSSQSSSRMSSSSSTGTGTWKGGYDTNADGTIKSQVLALGSEGAVMGAVNLYSNNEPLQVTKLNITLVGSTSTLDSFLVYDELKRYLGRATLDTAIAGGKTYALRMPVGTLTLPRRDNYLVYVRADLKEFDQGGSSNQTIQIASFGIEGNGEWSNEEYDQTYADTFPIYATARARISKVENADPANGNFTTGSNKRLGAFRFYGEGDSQGMNNLRVTQLRFEISASNGVTVSDVYIRRQDGDTQSSCTVSGNIATCASIPASIGSVKDNGVIQVFGTVSASNATNPTLRLTLNAAGTSSTPGDILWTDGEATFTWVPVDSPIASSTFFN
jgi:S-layer homology domain